MTEQTADVQQDVRAMGERARQAYQDLSLAGTDAKNAALLAGAAKLRAGIPAIIEANGKDMAYGRDKGQTPAMLDRLLLDEARIEAMAAGLEAIATLKDPIGDIMAEWDRPNGLKIARVRVPLGVIGIIYESRPNVTADAGALCLKSGNAAILRGGSESIHSSGAIVDCLRAGLKEAGINQDAIQMIPTRDRSAVGALLSLSDYVDVIVPRGGKGLIERVQREARMPVFSHLDGICHVYLDKSADPKKALEIVLNAKMRRTGICGAMETLLVNADVADDLLPPILGALAEKGCELRGDEAVRKLDDRVIPAVEEDWTTEYLDAILSIRTVADVKEAVAHINRNGSHHTDSIVAEDDGAAETFLAQVDSAIVIRNASTQYADGGEFGMGAEIGISTGRMHARGPVGTEQLTSFKYVVRGDGQTRP